MREGDSKGLTERRERARGKAREREEGVGRGGVVHECVDVCCVPCVVMCMYCMYASVSVGTVSVSSAQRFCFRPAFRRLIEFSVLLRFKLDLRLGKGLVF